MTGFTTRTLGKTGLTVSPLGIGGSSGISGEDLIYAFDRGINYFFLSSDLHHFFYQKSAETLRQLCGKGSATRDKVVLATVSYVNNPDKILAILIDQFTELGVDYIDVFHWGWLTEGENCDRLFETTRQLQDGGEIARIFREELLQQATEINQELVKKGLVRFAGASFHSRQLAREWLTRLDVVMLRYNLAHLGVERGIFPFLAGDKTLDPGLVIFNVAHEGQRLISTPPPDYPPDGFVPTIPDCYRYALSNPYTDVVLAGLQNRTQVDEALAAMEKGPLTQEEIGVMREYGENWYAKRPGQKSLGDVMLQLSRG